MAVNTETHSHALKIQGLIHGQINPTSAARIGLSILGVLHWDDILKCRGAWDTIVWFAALVRRETGGEILPF